MPLLQGADRALGAIAALAELSYAGGAGGLPFESTHFAKVAV